jgi:SAM-dependent methyltransferase
MFREEAHWIRNALSPVVRPSMKIIDVGASSHEFRTRIQPHIHEQIHRPILEIGAEITYADMKHEPGIDLVVDLASRKLAEDSFPVKYDLIICCNILEHVADREVFLGNLVRFARPGSYLLVTVPRRYPHHADPIDTLYRPDADRLVSDIRKHTDCKILTAEELVINNKEYYVLKPGRKLDYLLLRAPRKLARWYVKPLRWRQTCALLQIPPA